MIGDRLYTCAIGAWTSAQLASDPDAAAYAAPLEWRAWFAPGAVHVQVVVVGVGSRFVRLGDKPEVVTP